MTALDPNSASAQLRVIRSLMERATIYRSLSAPTALVGGLLSFVGFGLAYVPAHYFGADGDFLIIWLTILVLTGLTNAFVLWREARRRGTAFFSAGMKCAFKSLLPPFLCAGFFTIMFPGAPALQACMWVLFYGLGLLAMQHFAPRSIIVLGWCFLLAGLGSLVMMLVFYGGSGADDVWAASREMALTFGLFHIIYANAVWAMGGERADAPAVSANEAENV